jgi:lipopolysaccharide/colanic/teichoic acid biosynthesis glycosyltransferase
MLFPEQTSTSGYIRRRKSTVLLKSDKSESFRSFSAPKILEGSKGHVLYLTAKRVGDIAAASLALVVLLPFMAVIALFIWLQDHESVLYYQERVGKNGQLFKFYKFRSMVRNADALKAEIEAGNEASGPIFKMKNDPRVTPLGRVLRRYSLDELPQLWNVLVGDMSLVGPRPHLPAEVAQYRPDQLARLRVQPGLICLREVSGRSRLSFEQWVQMDLAYIEKRSLGLDLHILWRAVPAVLRADGAF